MSLKYAKVVKNAKCLTFHFFLNNFYFAVGKKGGIFPAKNTENSGCQLCQSYEMNHKKIPKK